MAKEEAKKSARRRTPVAETTDEIVESELTNTSKTQARRLRVYKRSGDFFLDLPPGCRCTFGYFNPASAGMNGDVRYGNTGRGMETMKTTALRIYQGAGDKQQLACFLGVDGFRDDTIKLTKIVERLVVERRMADDGEGTVEWGGKQQREMTALPEPEFSVEDEPIF